MKFTLAQQQAIEQQQQNILVAAAAGSGKTAVLVERIIQKILQRHCHVDELVVLTFTNAAAQEMRLRIRKRLEQVSEQSEGEQAQYLKNQLQRLNQAKISTFHAFCIQLLRQYYYATDLDPQFRIGDEFELALLKTQAMETTLEQFYEVAEAQFLAFIQAYSSDRGDESVQELIYQLSNFKQAVVDQESWQQASLQNYLPNENFLITPIGKLLAQQIHEALEMWEQELIQAMNLIDHTEKNAEKAQVIIESYLEAVQRQQQALATGTWEAYRKSLVKVEVANWPAKVAPDAKQLVDRIKKQITAQLERYQVSQLRLDEQFATIHAQLQQLMVLTKVYEDNFAKLKQQRNIVDFNDLERKTLNLLQREPEIAEQYQQSIHELLVDEYQDTNEVQETIVQLCSKGNNVFMVGDVKQSIYRFRSADPTLFQAKYQTYTKLNDSGLRIDLNQNFRSRHQVLDFINYTFEQLMDETVGEIEYDEHAKLYLGADYPAHPQMQVELDVLTLPEQVEKIENQAYYLVERIQHLIANEFIVQGKDAPRPIRYADIAILFRTRSSLFERVSELLKVAQIPYVAQERGGYFDASEIRILLAILRVIDNPFDDIEYASWLRSPVIGCDENDLLTIRLHQPKQHLCESVHQLDEMKLEPKLLKKLTIAKQYELNWRKSVKQKPLAEWIEQILFETGYYDFVGGLANGIHRQANIDALIDKARTYEAIGFRSLFKFNRFITAMQKQNQDFTNSRSIAEQENVVQLMTIHKSKGLEFPVVIVAELQKQFNRRDSMKSLVLDKQFGASLTFVHEEKNYTVRSIVQTFIAEQIDRAQLAEELRILYVALTRAKEKLILVAQTSKTMEVMQKQYSDVLMETQARLSPQVRTSAKSYFDWLMQALIRHRVMSQFQSQLPVAPPQITQEPLQLHVNYHQQSFVSEEMIDDTLAQLAEKLQNAEYLPDVSSKNVEAALAFTYPHQAATKHYAQVSISDLKRLAQEQADVNTYEVYQTGMTRSAKPQELLIALPSFMQREQKQVAQALIRGNAYHQAMQYLPQTIKTTAQAIEEYLAQQAFTDEQRALINSEWIEQFLATGLGEKFKQAQHVQRELPFSLLRAAETVYPQWSEQSQAVLMRGIFDAVYHLENEIIIVDYKTDFVGSFDEAMQAELRQRYQIQMETYLLAAKQLFADQQKLIRGELYFFQAQQSLKFK
ncbi:MAG: helicase-exonuclease AddAB subunit AddA [Culicoidibacterales bacterium]